MQHYNIGCVLLVNGRDLIRGDAVQDNGEWLLACPSNLMASFMAYYWSEHA